MTQSFRDLSGFSGDGYDIGRGKLIQIAWLATSTTIFMRWWLPARARTAILRCFGAEIASDVLIRHRVRIHWPWKLAIGANSWIGEGVWILNLEPVTIGHNTCVSQDVFICTGSHDRRSPTFEFDNAPIEIGNGAWLAARSVVLRGTKIGDGATVSANCVVTRDVPPMALYLG